MEKKSEDNQTTSANKIINKKTHSTRNCVIGIVILIILIVLVMYFLKKNNNQDNTSVTNNVVSSNEISSEEINHEPQMPEAKTTDSAVVAYDTYNQEDVSYKELTLGGDVAYSIDYGAEEPNGELMTFRKYLSDAGMAVLLNGYPNRNPEEMQCANSDEAYIATQMAVWEVMNRTGESEKATKIFRVENLEPIEGREESCNRIINAASKLVEKAENEPYTDVPVMHINNSNINIVKNIGEDALIGPYTVSMEGVEESKVNYIRATLENAPESAMVTDENGNEKKLLASGDSVYVKINGSEVDSTFDIKFEASVDRVVGLIYENINSEMQDYVKLGTELDNLEGNSTIEWSTSPTIGTIDLTVIDNEDNPVVGARFALKSREGKTYGEIERGTDGKIMFYGVPEGEYILEQISVPEGYKLSETAKNITVNGGKTTVLTFTDKKLN